MVVLGCPNSYGHSLGTVLKWQFELLNNVRKEAIQVGIRRTCQSKEGIVDSTSGVECMLGLSDSFSASIC